MPYPNNCPQLQDLPDLPPQEIAALPGDVLAVLQQESEAALKQAKAAKARLDGALVLKYGARIAAARRAVGKDSGTVRLRDGDITVVADLPKRIAWDQEKLGQMVERIRAAGDDVREYVEVTYRVAERNYAAWPRAIREGFEPARTVRPGQLTIELLVEEAR
ncbi:MAG TPA: hypothetical protein PKA33_15840 [Amaricoccus sp.]|uniref:hypothetical protein n=1 Tax=Amaricoccus sp. TaxID=1872485 RepID=UPI002C6ED98E|nr:hypothetical protein [Amaricoccus sp.]HMQ92661.1 hypothetical protein [Amaricoccus sp.]HMR53826.1 hypothetical protein [Amaricoccus sp.]HMR60769.1 hypothetical protein [Amaricoccus sp.]HMU00821.1 hypothetical protein [Amaricoccus sp.]